MVVFTSKKAKPGADEGLSHDSTLRLYRLHTARASEKADDLSSRSSLHLKKTSCYLLIAVKWRLRVTAVASASTWPAAYFSSPKPPLFSAFALSLSFSCRVSAGRIFSRALAVFTLRPAKRRERRARTCESLINKRANWFFAYESPTLARKSQHREREQHHSVRCSRGYHERLTKREAARKNTYTGERR